MARNVGRVARRIWSCCSMSARSAIAESGASSSSSSSPSSAPAARPSLRNPSSPATQQPLFGSKQSVHYYARLPGEIGCIASLMPRHSATAGARLVSKLSGDLTPQIEGSLARYVSPI